MGCCTTRSVTFFTADLWPLGRGKKYIASDFNIFPKEYEKYMLADYDFAGDDPEPACHLAAFDQEAFTVTDILGTCNFMSGFSPYPAIHTPGLKAGLVAAATGAEIDGRGLHQVAKRIVTLIRACNNRLGLRRKDDTVPDRFFKMTPRPPYQPLDRGKFDNYLDCYYRVRGWNSQGVPTGETLAELDLGFVAEEFERTGVL